MNMTCNFARDLAELYHENLVSAETADAIRSHLKTCTQCRNYYREYQALSRKNPAPAVRIFPEDIADHPDDSDYLSDTEERLCASLSERLRRRRFWGMVGTSAVVGAGSVMLAVGLLLTHKGRTSL